MQDRSIPRSEFLFLFSRTSLVRKMILFYRTVPGPVWQNFVFSFLFKNRDIFMNKSTRRNLIENPRNWKFKIQNTNHYESRLHAAPDRYFLLCFQSWCLVRSFWFSFLFQGQTCLWNTYCCQNQTSFRCSVTLFSIRENCIVFSQPFLILLLQCVILTWNRSIFTSQDAHFFNCQDSEMQGARSSSFPPWPKEVCDFIYLATSGCILIKVYHKRLDDVPFNFQQSIRFKVFEIRRYRIPKAGLGLILLKGLQKTYCSLVLTQTVL